MHHKNHKNSTSNFSNPQHHQPKPAFPNKPAPSSEKKSALSRLRERFQEKPATREEIQQLGLNAKREIYKTQIRNAKASRASRFSGFGGGGRQPSYRRSSPRATQTGSFLFDSGNSGGGFLDMGNGPSLDFITGGGQKPKGRGKPQRTGLEDLFT